MSASAFARTFSTVSRLATAANTTQPAAASTALRFRGARKRLGQHGVQALLPTAKSKFPDSTTTLTSPDQSVVDVSMLPSSERVWRRPLLSKRKAAVLRKEAKRTGTYGSFDPQTGTGWDPIWDVELAMANPRCLGRYTALRVPKKSAQRRSREERAQNIESKLEGMDERMEELQAERHKNKPPVTFENTYKNLMKVKK
jgi:hypothetical protein